MGNARKNSMTLRDFLLTITWLERRPLAWLGIPLPKPPNLTPRQATIRSLMFWAGLAVLWVALFLFFRSN
jgi:hypothetical protein